MTGPRLYKPAVIWFTKRMLSRLVQKEEKSNWRQSGFKYLMGSLVSEVRELNDAINKHTDNEAIIDECADVANYAMMIADKVRAQ